MVFPAAATVVATTSGLFRLLLMVFVVVVVVVFLVGAELFCWLLLTRGEREGFFGLLWSSVEGEKKGKVINIALCYGSLTS